MRKSVAAALAFAVLGLAGVSHADTFVANTAKNQRGEEVHPDYGGYDATRIASAGAAGEELVCSGRCVLAGILMSDGAGSSTVTFYDTSVAGVSGAARAKLIHSFRAAETGPATRLPRPIRFSNGIAVRLSSIGSSEAVTVLYVDLDQR
jgi:hypothetical protein